MLIIINEGSLMQINSFQSKLYNFSDAEEENNSPIEKKRLFSKGFSNPDKLFIDLHDSFQTSKNKEAELLALEIERKSKAISDINRHWSLFMQESLPKTAPGDNKKTAPVNTNNTNLKAIDDIIKNQLGDRRGLEVITGGKKEATFEQLQQMNASMTAFCDYIRVDIDKDEQKFKNTMSQFTFSQQEVTDFSRYKVDLFKG